MRKFGFKILMVFMMLISQVNIAAAQTETPNDDVIYTKTAEVVEGTVNTWDITLEVKGKPATTVVPTDIVLVLDVSGSMVNNNSTRLARLKESATQFVDKIIGDEVDSKTRISLVTFSNTAQEIQEFTNNKKILKDQIKGLTAGGATFLQGGIRVGREVFNHKSDSENKHMIIITDGMPTSTYRITFEEGRREYIENIGNNRTVWKDSVPEEFFNYTGTDNVLSGGNTSLISNSGRNPVPTHYDANNSAIAEGGYAKNTNEISLFTIGLDTTDTTAATLKEIASKNQFFEANPESLGAIYDKIASKILSTITDASITDIMAQGFEITEENVKSIKASQGTYSYDSASGSLKWNIGDLDKKDGTDPKLNSAKLTYRVEITDDILETKLALDGLFPTNKSAILSYTDTKKNEKTKPVDSPMVDPTFFTVEKVLMTSDGKVIEDASLPFKIGVDSEAQKFAHESNINAGKEHIYTTLRHLGDYLATEYSKDIYTSVIKVNGELVENGEFTLDATREDQNIVVYNTEVEMPKIDADKSVSDESGDGLAEAGEKLTYTLTATNTSKVPYRNLSIQDDLNDLSEHVNIPEGNVVYIDNGGEKSETTLKQLMDGFSVRLEAGETITITFDVVVKSDLSSDVKKLLNVATIGTETPGTEIETGAPDLISNKAVVDANTNEIAEAGELLTYTISAENIGNVIAKNVLIRDELKSLEDYIDVPGVSDLVTITNGTDVSTKTVPELMDGFYINIKADTKVTIVFQVKVIDDLEIVDDLKLKNIAMVGTMTPGTDIKTGGPKLESSKSVKDANNNGHAEANEKLHYTITARNNGTVTTGEIVIKDDLVLLKPYIVDPSKEILNINNNGTITVATVADLMGGKLKFIIPKDGEVELTFSVTVMDNLDPTKVSELVNIAYVADQDNTAKIPTGKVDLESSKTVTDANTNGFAEAGETLTYVLSLKNNSEFDAKALQIKDTLANVIPHVNDTKDVVVYVDNGGVKTEYTIAQLINGFDITLDKGKTFTATFEVVVKEDLNFDKVKVISNLATVGKDVPEVEIPTGAPNLEGTKSVADSNGNGKAEPGETLSYTLKLENKGKVKAHNVKIHDSLKDLLDHVKDPKDNHVTIIQGTNVSILSVADLMSDDGITRDIEAGEIITLTFDLVVIYDLNTDDVKVLRNVATLGDKTPEVEIPTGAPILVGTKSVVDGNGNKHAERGETLHYTLTVNNSGNVDAENVKIQDTLEDLKDHVVDPLTNVVKINGVDSKTVQDLISGFELTVKPNETITITFELVVKDDLNTDEVKVLRNIATIGDKTPEVEIPTGAPKLEGTKSVIDGNGNKHAEQGETLYYTLTVKNSGNVDAEKVMIQDTLADLVDHVVDPMENVVTLSNDVKKTVADLIKGFELTVEPNETITITFEMVVKDDLNTDEVKVLRNIATIGDKTPEVEIPTGAPSLEGTKSVIDGNGNKHAEKGETLYYTLTVKNSGNVDANNVKVQDTLEDLKDHVVDPLTNVVKINGVDSKTVQELVSGFELTVKPNETITITFELVVKDDLNTDEVKVLRNIATIGDKTPEVEIPTGAPKLEGTKSVIDGNGNKHAEQGETLYYTLTVKNSGNVDAEKVMIQDTLADLVDHVVDPMENVVTLSNDVKKTVADLIKGFELTVEPNETITITFELVVKDDLDTDEIKVLRNIATIGDKTPEVEIPTGAPILVGTKAVHDANENGYAEAGESITYTLTVKNSGNVDANNVKIQDTLDDLLAHVKDPMSNVVKISNHADKTVQDLYDGFGITVKPDETIIITFELVVKDDLDSEIKVLRNIATIGDDTPEVEIPIGAPILVGTKVVHDANENGFAEAGEKLRYTLTVENKGTVKDNAVFIQDEFADLLDHIEDPKASVVSISNSDSVTVQDLMDGFTIEVDVNEVVTIEFEVQIIADLDTSEVKVIRNSAVIGSNEPEVELPTGAPKVTADKSVVDENEDKIAQPGEVLTYTISVINYGNVAARDVLIKDDLAGIFDYFDRTYSTTVTVNKRGIISTYTLEELMNGFLVDIDAGKDLTVVFNVRVLKDLDLDKVHEIKNIATVGELKPEAKIETPVPVVPEVPEIPKPDKPKPVLPSTGVQAIDNGLAIALIVGGILLVFKALRKKVD